MTARQPGAIDDLFAVGNRRAREAAVVDAAVDYVQDREGRHGSATTRYGRLRRAVRDLVRGRHEGALQ